jgi:hypothetical protein
MPSRTDLARHGRWGSRRGQEELNDLDVVLVKSGCIEGRAKYSLLVWVGARGQEVFDFRYIALLRSLFEGMALIAAVAVGDVEAAATGQEAQKRE